jgi:hypothetical protein
MVRNISVTKVTGATDGGKIVGRQASGSRYPRFTPFVQGLDDLNYQIGVGFKESAKEGLKVLTGTMRTFKGRYKDAKSIARAMTNVARQVNKGVSGESAKVAS